MENLIFLCSVVNNLSEGIHISKSKYGHDDKNMRLVEINISIATAFLNILSVFYQHKCHEKLQEGFVNTYQFSIHSINEFVLLLQKGVYPYE